MEERLNIQGKRVVVVGLGRSGLAAALWLAGRGALVTASDVRAESEFSPDVIEKSRGAGIALETGGHGRTTFEAAHMLVVSPGVPPDIEPIRSAAERGIPVLGELELACRLLDIPMVGVTGTNGKSTVTALLGEMIGQQGLRVFVGGNLGTPLMELVSRREEVDWGVIEVSSFQLDTMESFKPVVSVILNVSPDHLDRYEDYEAYVQSKLRIFRFQKPGGFVILNDDDERLRDEDPGKGLRVLRYGLKERSDRSAWISGDSVISRFPGPGTSRFSLERFVLPGLHNRENLMAAVLAALGAGVSPEAVQRGVDGFKGLSHRMEFVASYRGVDVYNDSKATNVDAAVRAVESFDRPIILIAGGRHKGADYGPLVRASLGRVKDAVFLGEARDLLAKDFEGEVAYRIVDTLDQAVSEALDLALPGDVVLLAPACSSFDMFQDYVHRGRAFAESVRRFVNGGESA